MSKWICTMQDRIHSLIIYSEINELQDPLERQNSQKVIINTYFRLHEQNMVFIAGFLPVCMQLQ